MRELVQDRGLDWGCFAVYWGMSWVETAGALRGALRGGGAHWIGLMSGFWRGGTISTRITLSPLSLYLSIYLHSPLLFISGERFSIYGPLLDHSNLESTAIPIRIVASGTSTITALTITPNFTPESPKQNSCLFTLW